MGEFILKYWLTAVFCTVSAIFGTLYRQSIKKYKEMKIENEATRRGLISLLRSDIINYHNEYVCKGVIPLYLLDSVNGLYKDYTTLYETINKDNQDETIEKLVKEIRSLKIDDKMLMYIQR